MFGRRKGGPAKRAASEGLRHPGPDDDGVSRVIPKAIWDEPRGNLLRKIGMSPDDPSNLMPTQESVQARFEEIRALQADLLAKLNERMPQGVTLVPWAMIPYSIWQGPHADFVLLVCDLYPCGAWNTMLLPDDEAGARALDLPRHPGYVPDGLEDGANRLIGEIRQRVDAVYAEANPGMARGDMSALEAFKKATDDATIHVIGLAHVLSTKVFGEEAYNRHWERFGEVLGGSPRR